MQMSYYERDVWFDHTALDWASRTISAEPLRQMISAAGSEFIDPEGPVVEIGSGVGALSNFLTTRTISAHIEGSMKSATLHAEQTAAPVINGDLYNLPVRDASVAGVVGLLVIDAMTDMQKVVAECSRVLQPDGTFVYFHDLHASFNAISTVLRQAGLIPIPLNNLELAALDPRSFERFQKIVSRRHNSEIADRFGYHLTDSDVHMDIWRADGQEAITLFSDIISSDRKLKRTILRGGSTAVFSGMLGSALKLSGMTVLHDGPVYQDTLVPRSVVTLVVDGFPEDYNVIRFSAFRADSFGYSDEYPDDVVSVGSEILQVVAKKS